MKKTTSIMLHPDTVAAVMADGPPSLSEGIERVLRRALNLSPRPHGKPGNPNFGPGYGRKVPVAAPPVPVGEKPPPTLPPCPSCGGVSDGGAVCDSCHASDDRAAPAHFEPPPCGDDGRKCDGCGDRATCRPEKWGGK